jgi:hypothetical protein
MPTSASELELALKESLAIERINEVGRAGLLEIVYDRAPQYEAKTRVCAHVSPNQTSIGIDVMFTSIV